MIELKGVSKIFDDKTEALKGVDLVLPDCGLVVVFGKSGSGKSTLLNIIGGIENLSGGSFVVDGQEITDKNVESYRREKIGFVFQDFRLLDNLTLAQNISLAGEIAGQNAPVDTDALLDAVGLSGFGKALPNSLSGGEAQRAAIARALAKDGASILADEPTGNLDGENAAKILTLLKKFSADRLVVVATHDKTAAGYADYIIGLKDGKIVKNDLEGKRFQNAPESPAQRRKRLSFKTCARLAVWSLGKHRTKKVLIVAAASLLISAVTIGYSLLRMDEYGITRNMFEDGKLSVLFTQAGIARPKDEIEKLGRELDFDPAPIFDASSNDPTVSIEFGFSLSHRTRYRGRNYWKTDFIAVIDDLSKYDITLIAGDAPSAPLEVSVPKTFADSIIAAGYYNKSKTVYSDDIDDYPYYFLNGGDDIVKVGSYADLKGLPIYFKNYEKLTFKITGVFEDRSGVPEKYLYRSLKSAKALAETDGVSNEYRCALQEFMHRTIIASEASLDAMETYMCSFGLPYAFVGAADGRLPVKYGVFNEYSDVFDQNVRSLDLAADEIIIDEDTAGRAGLSAGDTVTLENMKHGELFGSKISRAEQNWQGKNLTFKIKAVFKNTDIMGAVINVYVSEKLSFEDNAGVMRPVLAVEQIKNFLFNGKRNFNGKVKGIEKYYRNLDDEIIEGVQSINNLFIKSNIGFATDFEGRIKRVAKNGRIAAVPIFAVTALALFMFTIIVVAINIDNKSAELGVLKALGARGRDVSAVLTLQSVGLAVIEFLIGTLLGRLGIFLANYFIYYGDAKIGRALSYPADTFFVIAAFTLFLSFVATRFTINRLFKKSAATIMRE